MPSAKTSVESRLHGPGRWFIPVGLFWLTVLAPLPAEAADAEAIPCPAPRIEPSHGLIDGGYAGMFADPAATALTAAGCASSSCHGGPEAGNHDLQSFAATLWAERDPHAGGYETLLEPQSRRIAAALGIGEPHRARQCLACHSVQAVRDAPLPPEALADGVSCGSCHGDATGWLAIHHLPEWRHVGPEARAAMGWRDVSDVTSRVRTCIPCHVGDASREVDHDLVAAGHPRLAFEFAAYQRLWPRHWNPRKKIEADRDFAERSWATGQAETLAAVARLVEVRIRRAIDAEASGQESRWPEFAEFDCYSCHRGLSPERVAAGADGAFRNPFPGTPSWQPWSVAAARLLSTAIDEPVLAEVGAAATDLRDLFAPDWSAGDRQRLDRAIARAGRLAEAAEAAAAAIETRPTVVLDASHDRLDAAVASAPSDWRFWDAATQTYLLMEAAGDGGPARLGRWSYSGYERPVSSTRAALDDMRASLRFKPGSGGPDGFDPAGFTRDRRAVPYGLPSAR
jgi:hypothetical protein